eukprot:s880_g20.t1
MTTEEVVRRAFLNADVDQSGTLDIQEFGRLLQLLNPSTWSQERLQLFFLRADKDGSGRVDLQETLDWLLYGASRRKKEETTKFQDVAAQRPPALDDAELEEIAERKRRSSEVSRIMTLRGEGKSMAGGQDGDLRMAYESLANVNMCE